MDSVTPERLMEVFGGNIRRLRLASGLSQTSLAHALGCHPPYISDLERGKRYPQPETLTRLADALKTTPSDLFKEPKKERIRS